MLMMRHALYSGRYKIASAPIETVAETASTNADMLLRAQQGGQEGLWLRAEQQQSGRGRLQRRWVSPPGNLYISTIIRLGEADPSAATLALVAGIAFHDCAAHWLDHSNNAPALLLKWPNDLLIGDAKLGGILLERTGDAVVAGFGMNISSAPDLADRSAVALNAVAGDNTADAATVATKLAACFADELTIWRDPGRGLAAIIARWEKRAHPRGAALAVTASAGGRLTGKFDGLTPDGALRLRDDGGKPHIINAGDVDLLIQTGNS